MYLILINQRVFPVSPVQKIWSRKPFVFIKFKKNYFSLTLQLDATITKKQSKRCTKGRNSCANI